MQVTKAVLVNYNFDPKDWWRQYGIEALVYDRSDDGVERKFDANVRKTENRGNVDFDKLSYLVEFYDDLPEIFIWSKTNIAKYCDGGTFMAAITKGEFAPLMKPDHKTYSDRLGVVCRYRNGWYEERNDSWYLGPHPAHNISSFAEWAQMFNLPCPDFLPFAPGGSYLLTKERVYRYSRDFYEKMRDTLPYCQLPGEAQLAERSYGLLWQ